MFQRLHTNENSRRKPVIRATEQVIVEDECTFRPRISSASPFLSERTARASSASKTRSKREGRRPVLPEPSAPDESPSTSIWIPPSSPHVEVPVWSVPESSIGVLPRSGGSNYNSNQRQTFLTPFSPANSGAATPGAGLFVPGYGLIPGPPQVPGIPLYLYDPLNPPAFTSGTCLSVEVVEVTDSDSGASEEEEVVVEESTEVDDGIPKAPQLPSWAFTSGGDPDRAGEPVGAKSTASSKIVIKKSDKPPPKAEVGGY